MANKQRRYTQNYTHTHTHRQKKYTYMHVPMCVRVTYKKKHLYATLNVKRSQVLSTCAGSAAWLGRCKLNLAFRQAKAQQIHNKDGHTHTDIHSKRYTASPSRKSIVMLRQKQNNCSIKTPTQQYTALLFCVCLSLCVCVGG